VDRLRALGNAVVPQVVEEIGRAIMTAEAALKASAVDTNAITGQNAKVRERLVPEEGLEPPTRALRMPRAMRKSLGK
jgi:hypothetical protein